MTTNDSTDREIVEAYEQVRAAAVLSSTVATEVLSRVRQLIERGGIAHLIRCGQKALTVSLPASSAPQRSTCATSSQASLFLNDDEKTKLTHIITDIALSACGA